VNRGSWLVENRATAMLSLLMSMPRRAVLNSASSFALGSLALSSGLPASATEEAFKVGGSPVFASESIMAPKAHGTSDAPVQKNLKWNVDMDTAGERVEIGPTRSARCLPL
jgi:hypothetical protein